VRMFTLMRIEGKKIFRMRDDDPRTFFFGT
jgi:hypothetical protein